MKIEVSVSRPLELEGQFMSNYQTIIYLAKRSIGIVGAWIDIFDVNVPRGMAVERFVSCVAPPQTLNQHCSSGYLSEQEEERKSGKKRIRSTRRPE